ncbi:MULTISPECIES: WD40 repeat domain-containing serine/threonine protein kinase [Frankia]|uniref:WD40 repeat domain-containing serine/threonine protein kinase n=1 Tax=Frankia TaxID=1854 RepID=UPI0002FD6A01|nr:MULTISPECIES: serine/threonine-protein kinase [Frankia]
MIVDRKRVGAALPGYELGDQLGAGGFGLVLAGWHRRLQRDVAIKVLTAGGYDRAAAGFAAEARILARLDHAHIVRVYDYVETGDLRLIVMEMLGGGTLTSRRTTLSQPGACAVGLAVAGALSCAHAEGVLHRDIKPDNVLFDLAGMPKVADFGIAKLVLGGAGNASAVIGTPLFMAPEQRAGGRLGAATDLYALGMVLYLLLGGVTPGEPNQSAGAVRGKRGARDLRTPVRVPAPVAEVVTRALAENPADRPQSAQVFALELARAAASAYGPGWIARSGVPLRLDDDVRLAAERPPATIHAASPSASSPPASSPPASSSPASSPPALAPRGSPDRRRHRAQPDRRPTPQPPAGRRGRRRLLAVAAALLLAVAGTVVTVVASHQDVDPPAAEPLGPPLTGHTNWVTSVAFSTDGRLLASASKDGTVRLWAVSDSAHAHALGPPLPGRTDGVVSLAFSPDSRLLASGNWDATVRLWDVSDPAHPHPPTMVPPADAGPVSSVEFYRDDRTLVESNTDGVVRVWDVSDPAHPQPRSRFPTGHTDNSWARPVLAPNGTVLAGPAGDNSVGLWDMSDLAHPRMFGRPLSGHRGSVYGIAFSTDLRTLATGSKDTTVRLWDITDPAAPAPLGRALSGHTSTVWSVAFSPDGRTLASASFDQTIRLWDVTDRAHPRPLGPPLSGHTDFVQSVAFSPDGRLLASGGRDHTIRLWTIPAGSRAAGR